MQNNTIFNVAFRCYNGEWEAYGINQPFYGYGETLTEAKTDVKEAIEALTETPAKHVKINEVHEHRVAEATETHPDVWVRTHHDLDGPRMLERRAIREYIKEALKQNPQYVRTFDNGESSFGDIIAIACLEDDMLIDLLEQVGEASRIFACVAYGNRLYWQCIFTEDAENKPDNVIDIKTLELSDAATVGDFMRATKPSINNPQRFLTAV